MMSFLNDPPLWFIVAYCLGISVILLPFAILSQARRITNR